MTAKVYARFLLVTENISPYGVCFMALLIDSKLISSLSDAVKSICVKEIFQNRKQKELHIRHIMVYKFWKRINIKTATKNIRHVYLDRAPVLRTIKKWFGRIRNGNFDLDGQFL